MVFNVPALKLKQETKSLYSKFGKILQFNLMKDYKAERFTEVYHISYERIHSARLAKRMTDGKEFYGDILHVCYAPEFENLQETKQKLMQRSYDVTRRLNTLENERNKSTNESLNVQNQLIDDKQTVQEFNHIYNEVKESFIPETLKTIVKDPVKYENNSKLFMGNENTILIGKRKRKWRDDMSELTAKNVDNVEIIDCTKANKETITNINESLNYNNFGNEIVRKVAEKPINRIKFN